MPKSTAKPKPPPDGLLIIWDADEPFPVRREEVDLVLSTMRALERVQAGAPEVLAHALDQLHNDANDQERKQ